ncbi:hypothetical protein KHQ81_09610 [Mycoplasmatota bacterium]|nr:hypothetical protein KHQ81_09610 [Mycoplasmatota bacterium]
MSDKINKNDEQSQLEDEKKIQELKAMIEAMKNSKIRKRRIMNRSDKSYTSSILNHKIREAYKTW